jgi:hypothetical protein
MPGVMLPGDVCNFTLAYVSTVDYLLYRFATNGLDGNWRESAQTKQTNHRGGYDND